MICAKLLNELFCLLSLLITKTLFHSEYRSLKSSLAFKCFWVAEFFMLDFIDFPTALRPWSSVSLVIGGATD